MNNKSSSWESTRKTYIKWLSNCKLRMEFSKNVKYEQLSLWWLSKLMDKDNINETQWFENLHKIFNNKKVNIKKDFTFFIPLVIKIFKKLIAKIIFTIFIKIFFSEKINKSKKNRNCFYAIFSNFIKFNNYYIDRQYGLYGLKKKENQIYFIEIQENFSLIFDYFKIKKNYQNYHLNIAFPINI